ncbi:hypothetical protein RB653_009344 [Dictyostelium firmibasis]|uniref:Uncharacterized protein n=1 Tax=Dictyostelium firmibasis TaxID=79012 RepID=A0AAN7TU41_9MYCE
MTSTIKELINSSNNNNNNNNSNIKTLNHFIFKEVSIFLANKSTFKELLEYALISKKSFEIFRNIISYNGNICSIVFPFSSLKDYARNSYYNQHRNNTSTYKFKLLQNKETEFLSISIKTVKLDTMKSFLKKVFPNLKNVNIFNKYKTKYHLNKYKLDIGDNQEEEEEEVDDELHEFYDDTHKGFYSFERVYIDWDINRLPFSNKNEMDDIGSNISKAMNYQFSFKGIEKLKPRKIYFNSAKNYGIHLYGTDSILNYTSIRTIKFENNPSTPLFIKKALSLKNIKSLSLNLNNNSGKNGGSLEIDQCDFVYNVFKDANLEENSTLQRLVFKSIFHENDNMNCQRINRDPILFFTLLKSNNSLNTLGLEFFDIKNYKQLEPLLELKNIKTLYIYPNNIVQTLLHCLDNSNIKQLKIHIDNHTNDLDSHSEEILLGFFKKNNTIKKIVIEYLTLQQHQLHYTNFNKLEAGTSNNLKYTPTSISIQSQPQQIESPSNAKINSLNNLYE